LVGTGPVVVGEGQVVDSAVSYGSSVTLKPGAVAEGDVVAFGGDVVLEPGSVVEGDAVSFGGKVDKAEGAEVEGDVVSFGGFGAVVAKGVTLSAKHDSDADDERDREPRAGRSHGVSFSPTSFILRFAMLFGLGFLFLMFAPARMKLLEGELKRDPVKCGLTWLLGAVVLAVMTVLMAITIIGIPAVLALWTVVGLGLAMGTAAIASDVGLRLPVFRAKKSQAVVLAVGLLALMLLAKIPVVGTLAIILVLLVALGAVIRTRFGQPARGTPQPDTVL
ncbi:MAG: hypothetical protein ACYC8T_20300, partial [Myxococcaceae bacterium]